MKNIVRIDTHNTHGWQVRITRHGTRYSRFFSDSKYGRDEALEEARVYRDKLLSELPPAATTAKDPNDASLRFYIDETYGVHGDLYSHVVASGYFPGVGYRRITRSLTDKSLNKVLMNVCNRVARLRNEDSAFAMQVYNENLRPLAGEYRDYLNRRERVGG